MAEYRNSGHSVYDYQVSLCVDHGRCKSFGGVAGPRSCAHPGFFSAFSGTVKADPICQGSIIS